MGDNLRFEYFRLGNMPVRVAFNNDDDPVKVEVPCLSTGKLIIDNSYLEDIYLRSPDDIAVVDAQVFEQMLSTFAK